MPLQPAWWLSRSKPTEHPGCSTDYPMWGARTVALLKKQRNKRFECSACRKPSQNHRTLGVGRDLCGLSSPTPLLKQGHLEQAAQGFVQAGLEYLHRMIQDFGNSSSSAEEMRAWKSRIELTGCAAPGQAFHVVGSQVASSCSHRPAHHWWLPPVT